MIRKLLTPALLLLLIAAQIFFLYRMTPKQTVSAPVRVEPFESADLVIRIARLDGDAVVTSPLGIRDASEDEVLSLGEIVRTSPTTRAVISVEGYAEVLLGPASAMSFLSAQRGPRAGLDLFLKEGSAYFILESAASGSDGDTGLITVHSPNMSCAPLEAHRTEFLLSVEDDAAK